MKKGNWYVDDYFANTHTYHRIKKEIIRKKTKYQRVEIFDLYDFGRSLFIDGNPQSCEKSEWIYHECLVHPAMLLGSIEKNKKILVLGAGEGATARELLKYKNVGEITLVDIDKEAIEIFKKYLPMMHKGSFNNPKVRLLFGNAGDFLARNKEKYDVIISDITDLDFFNLGAKARKTEEKFYRLIAARLKKDGILAMHAGELSYDKNKKHLHLRSFLKKIFPSIYSYKAYIPFFENEWGFIIASQDKKFNPRKLSEKDIGKRISRCGIENKLGYLSPAMLKASFSFSPRLEKILEKY